MDDEILKGDLIVQRNMLAYMESINADEQAIKNKKAIISDIQKRLGMVAHDTEQIENTEKEIKIEVIQEISDIAEDTAKNGAGEEIIGDMITALVVRDNRTAIILYDNQEKREIAAEGDDNPIDVSYAAESAEDSGLVCESMDEEVKPFKIFKKKKYKKKHKK
ncbi:MAG: hypothetical protein Q8865_05560 [Bacillota bacterium]|nr:hypothetical protein [Bacillota bacterium]